MQLLVKQSGKYKHVLDQNKNYYNKCPHALYIQDLQKTFQCILKHFRVAGWRVFVTVLWKIWYNNKERSPVIHEQGSCSLRAAIYRNQHVIKLPPCLQQRDFSETDLPVK